MPKVILKDQQAREKLKAGADAVADIVKVTLGAGGKTVVINEKYLGIPVVTKDGVSVARAVTLKDEIESVGAQLIKAVAEKTLDQAGDGTTTSTVLAQAILAEAIKLLGSQCDPQELKRGMDDSVRSVVEYIKLVSTKMGADNPKLKDVATVSANGDSFIGNLIAEAFSKLGDNGILSIEDSESIDTYVKITNGIEIERGFMHPAFVTNIEKQQAVLDNPIILVANYSLNDPKTDILPYLEKIMKSPAHNTRPILLYVNDVDQAAFSFLVTNRLRSGLNVCVCRPPSSYGVTKDDTLGDIAAYTGATLISDEAGIKLQNVSLEHFGTAKKVVVSGCDFDGKTLFIEGAGDKSRIDSRISEIRAKVESTKDKAEREIHEKRLAKMTGSIGEIRVGAITDVERKEKKDRVDDAVRATKSAIEEGIVEGGGVALVRASYSLEPPKNCSRDYEAGVNVIKNALLAPFKQILLNADIQDAGTVLTRVREGDQGYNVRTRDFEDFIETGIIDPAKVVRVAVENANSVASMIIGSAGLMVESKNI